MLLYGMADERVKQWEEIAWLLIQAREKLEKHDLYKTPEGETLHIAISQAHGLFSRAKPNAAFLKKGATSGG